MSLIKTREEFALHLKKIDGQASARYLNFEVAGICPLP